MNTEYKYKIDPTYWVIACLGLIYILLPSTNNSLDAYDYAASAQAFTEIFRPHHLLYSMFGYVFALFGISNILSAMIAVNAVFATGCLIVMRPILLTLTNDKMRCALLLILLGSCFGFMRFATENETYIIPLFFSLWASLNYLRNRNIFTTSLLAAIACLFHQIHFFWWLGLMILALRTNGKSGKMKTLILYCSAALIVPLAYCLVFYFTENDSSNIIEYVFHDYMKYDSVEFTIKSVTLLLTPISFIRSFIQVHGYFLLLILKYPFLIIAPILSVILFIVGCAKLRKAISKKNSDQFIKIFASAHLIIFFLQLLFAFISDGNAEFMVMLPFALCIFFIANYDIKPICLKYFSIGILVWNLFLGIIPAHFIELSADKKLCHYIAKHPADSYLIGDRIKIDHMLNYYYPQQEFNFIRLKDENLDSKLDSLLQTNAQVITDMVNNTSVMSRSTMIGDNKDFLKKYNTEKIDSVQYDLGTLNISKLYLPDR
ncbi:hypothetical protein [Dysgonomonas sp. 520]|uniref:hypothetical protein n=1 Tax=Dysgonomonas sp. 520 TaxID=2302931 RepID=UPI0013CFAE8C|nr:hypothetical protein [Dysgonomonas sp. 520]NDW08885.1 hypothetical protein [Dysgonomonas sp. 520]